MHRIEQFSDIFRIVRRFLNVGDDASERQQAISDLHDVFRPTIVVRRNRKVCKNVLFGLAELEEC